MNEAEVPAYKAAVPRATILPHPPLAGFARVFNWCLDHFSDDVLVFLDDDISGVRTTIQPSRAVKGSEDILTVIENGIQAITDLDLTVCSWSRTQNTSVTDPVNEPIRPVQPVCVAFAIRGAARHRRYNEDLVGRGDIDWTLRTLMEDRAVYADMRFFFDNGRIFAGEGGNVGIVDEKQRLRVTKQITDRWGHYVSDDPLPWQKDRSSVPLRLRVERKSKMALG